MVGSATVTTVVSSTIISTPIDSTYRARCRRPDCGALLGLDGTCAADGSVAPGWLCIDAAEQLSQMLVAHRFRQMMIEACGACLPLVLVLSPPRERDQPHVPAPRLRTHGARDFVAVESRHANIEERRAGPESTRERKRRAAVGRHAYFVAREA